MNQKNAELVAGLRQLCDFIEANDDFEFVTGDTPQVEFHWREWYVNKSPEARRLLIADLARRLGKSEKVYADNFFWLRHNFGSLVQLEVVSLRDVVCERVVTGTRVIPAQPEHTIPAIPEHEVEVVEWRCEPILAAEGKE